MFLNNYQNNNVSYSAAWLHSELKRILGSSLIGLYTGDDLIYDSSGAITGIRQRQGQTGVKSGATLSRIKGSGGRNFIKSINPASGASFSIGSHVAKAAFIVSTTPNVPTAQQQILFSKNDDFSLSILSGSTTLSGSTDMSVYVDNTLTTNIGTSNIPHIYTITKNSTKNSTIYFPGSGSLNNLNSSSNLGAVVLCSIIPTVSQRSEIIIALKKHFGITDKIATDKLTKDLYDILGTSIMALYIGEDLVVDGSNQITSWPGRIGPTLTNQGSALLFTLSTLNERKCILGTANATQQLGYTDAAWFAKSFITVCKVGTNVVAYQTLAGGQPVSQIAAIMRNASTTSFFTDGARGDHYVNGVLTTTFPTNAMGIVVVEGINNNITSESGIGVGGNGGTARNGADRIGLAMQLSITQTAAQRAAVNIALRKYYGII